MMPKLKPRARYLSFNCLVKYLKPTGSTVSVHYRTQAPDAEAALDLAETMLRRDKRRRVVQILNGRAIQI